MSRDIKFRAWHEKLNRMIYDISVCNSQSEWSDESGKSWMFEDKIMQYIGAKDVNGVDLYEGDIITMTECDCAGNKYTYKGEIIFELLEYRSKTIESTILREGATMSLFPTYEFEVIGNVYEKQKLIKP